MGLLTKLAGETALYGVSSIIGRFLNYFLVPLYTAVFTPDQYGIVTELYAYIAFLNILYAYGLETAYFRFSTKEGHTEPDTYAVTFTSILITSLAFSLTIGVFSSPLSSWLGYPEAQHIILWIAGILAVDAIVAIPFARLRLQGKAKYFVYVKLTNITINVGLNLTFILLLPSITSYESLGLDPQWGIEYIFLSNLIANFMMILLLWTSFTTYQPVFSWNKLQPILIYAYPFLFTGLAAVTNEMLSRAMLRHWLPEGFYGDQSNLTALGIFGACYKISVFMVLAVQAFRYAAEPFFFSQAAHKNSPELFAKVMNWFVIFAAFSLLVVSLNLDWIGLLFLRSPEYREGLFVVPYLLLGGLLLGVYYNLSVWYKLTDKTIYGVYLAVGGAFITFILNYLLIPQWGYLGSAVIPVASYGTMVVASYALGRKEFPVPYQTTKGVFYVLMAVSFIWLSQYLSGGLNSLLSVRFLAPGLFVALVYFLEWKNLRNLIKS